MLVAQQVESRSITQRWLSHAGRLVTVGWSAFVTALIAWGWVNRNEGYLTAESGWGYALGIVGGSLMLLLLTYSLRKRWRVLRKAFSIRLWFQMHMLLGILGPLAIIFHSNFQLGSVNSTVAFVCMLLVSGSGLIGRYIYQQIHFGLYGEKIKLQQLLQDFEDVKKQMSEMSLSEKQRRQNEKLFKAVRHLINRQYTNKSFFSYFRNRKRARKIARAMKKFIAKIERRAASSGGSRRQTEKIYQTLDNCDVVLQEILGKLPGLHLFEKLFSLWHIVHVPIFFLMVGTVITHVIVVHMY